MGDSGVDICVNPVADAQLPVIMHSRNDTTIVAWEDWRNNSAGGNVDIYSAKIDPHGSLVNSISITFSTNGNGDWNDPSTWSGNVIPPPGADIIIRHAVNANINVHCKSIKVEQGASCNVSPGINLSLLP